MEGSYSGELVSHRTFWILAACSGLLMLGPIRTGDLPGYDDALYAHMAKAIVRTGDWINIQSNGSPALEHPPLFVWMQAALFSLFGFSDTMAKLPSALCGWGTVLLVYWVALRLTGEELIAAYAMFVLTTTAYFVKYTAHAMTDVPFTFFFLSAIWAWLKTEDDPRWYLVTAVFTALTQLSRGMMGFTLPLLFALHLIVTRRRPPLLYAASGLLIAFLPLAAWYAHMIGSHGAYFLGVQSIWLQNEVYGALSPPWRRYTGAPEYVWMLLKSYWPWLPAMIFGLITTFRNRDRRLYVLGVWAGVVFLACSLAKSRVLRYMLPAYPAFSILAAVGLRRAIPEVYLRRGLAILTPAALIAAGAIALFPPATFHATEIRPIAAALDSVTEPEERIEFYDSGQPRYDETNQLQWYGNRYFRMLLKREDFEEALRKPLDAVFVVDQDTYRTYFASRQDYRIVTQNGHLVILLHLGILASSGSSTSDVHEVPVRRFYLAGLSTRRAEFHVRRRSASRA
jgi:4-amino-4-deoxy-L-arabinose transferase-like glycosyltransferase